MSSPCPAWCAQGHTEMDETVDHDGRGVRYHVGHADAFHLLDRSEVRCDVRAMEITQHAGTVESTAPMIALGVEVGGGGPAAEVELTAEQTVRVALMLLQAYDQLERMEAQR